MTLCRFRTRLAPDDEPAPPLEERDEEPDKYGDNDDGPEDARNRDESLDKS